MKSMVDFFYGFFNIINRKLPFSDKMKKEGIAIENKSFAHSF